MSPFAATLPDFSPVSLSYAAALRGIKPRLPGAPFTYAQLVGDDFETLLSFAASNPEGRFFGLVSDEARATSIQNIADQRSVSNVAFLASPLDSLLQRLGDAASPLPALDFLVCDATTVALGNRLPALFDLAQKGLKPSGLFSFRYQSASDPLQTLRFLVNEVSPEMSADQAASFLSDIKNLGASWLAEKRDLMATLNEAIAKAMPDHFFSALNVTESVSNGTFSVMEALLPRQFAFVGDVVPAQNYLELSTPASAHAVLIEAKETLYYEILKDFAMQRLVRNDLWCRMPVSQTTSLPELFGAFTYGTITPREQIPGSVTVFSKYIDLTRPPFEDLLSLMTTLPMTIGDFLHHPSGKSVDPALVVEALQVLIALDIVRPMRSSYQGGTEVGSPQWALSYNAFHNVTPIETSSVRFASSIVGGPVSLPARDALVLQAIGRVGLQKSAGAVFLEMQRLAKDPVFANEILKTNEPTPEMADQVTREVVESSLARWYAYGLLAA